VRARRRGPKNNKRSRRETGRARAPSRRVDRPSPVAYIHLLCRGARLSFCVVVAAGVRVRDRTRRDGRVWREKIRPRPSSTCFSFPERGNPRQCRKQIVRQNHEKIEPAWTTRSGALDTSTHRYEIFVSVFWIVSKRFYVLNRKSTIRVYCETLTFVLSEFVDFRHFTRVRKCV